MPSPPPCAAQNPADPMRQAACRMDGRTSWTSAAVRQGLSDGGPNQQGSCRFQDVVGPDPGSLPRTVRHPTESLRRTGARKPRQNSPPRVVNSSPAERSDFRRVTAEASCARACGAAVNVRRSTRVPCGLTAGIISRVLPGCRWPAERGHGMRCPMSRHLQRFSVLPFAPRGAPAWDDQRRRLARSRPPFSGAGAAGSADV